MCREDNGGVRRLKYAETMMRHDAQCSAAETCHDISWLLRPGRGDDPWWALRHFVARAFDRETLHAAAQRVGVQVKDPCGAVWTFDDPATLSQSCEDVIALHFLQSG